MDYIVFLSSTKTTGSNVTVTGEKGGGVVATDGVTVEPSVSSESNNVQSNTNAEVADNSQNVAQETGGAGFFGSMGAIIPIYAIFIGVFYFFVLRPQKKRQKEAQTLINSLEVGDEVMTSSGYYGKITDVGEDICVIEFGTNKGVRIPVNKKEILKKETPKY